MSFILFNNPNNKCGSCPRSWIFTKVICDAKSTCRPILLLVLNLDAISGTIPDIASRLVAHAPARLQQRPRELKPYSIWPLSLIDTSRIRLRSLRWSWLMGSSFKPCLYHHIEFMEISQSASYGDLLIFNRADVYTAPSTPWPIVVQKLIIIIIH